MLRFYPVQFHTASCWHMVCTKLHIRTYLLCLRDASLKNIYKNVQCCKIKLQNNATHTLRNKLRHWESNSMGKIALMQAGRSGGTSIETSFCSTRGGFCVNWLKLKKKSRRLTFVFYRLHLMFFNQLNSQFLEASFSTYAAFIHWMRAG